FGSMIGSRGPLITATALKIFRGEKVGTIYGTISIGSGLGSGLGSWLGGLIHDWSHSYNLLIAFALVNVVLGLIPFLVVPALRRAVKSDPRVDEGEAVGTFFLVAALLSACLPCSLQRLSVLSR